MSPAAADFLQKTQRQYQLGNYAAALALADSAARYAPEFADVPYLRGHLYTALNRYDVAETAYRRVLELDPDYLGVRFRMGNNAFEQRRYQDALTLYQQERRLIEKRLDVDRANPAIDPSALPATWLQIGRVYRQTGVVDSAQFAFERALEIDSTYAEAYADLSQLYEDEGEPERSLIYARRAVALDPEHFEGQYLLGIQLLRAGEPEEAIAPLTFAAGQRPWFHGGLYNLGQALVRSGRREEGEHYLTLADSMQALQHEIDQARLSARQQANVPQRWSELAGLQLRAGRPEAAMRSLETALALNPADLALQNDVANLSAMMGDMSSAIRRYETILRNDSTFTDTWLNLGVAYAQSNRYEEARRAWKQVLKLAPEHPEALAYLDQLTQIEGGGT